ncbi:MAG: protease family protein [Thermoleophilaceae bacterium]|jgi:membrane protease YdiL (CAAX protease family)|nr:protease family protein [Thermoleophilaceae bacterium]
MAVAEPPQPPPAPDTAESPPWPLWLPLAGLGCGVTFALLALSVLSGIVGRTSSPGLTAAGTVLVDVSVVVACLLFAGLVARPQPWQFGLRGASLKFTAQMAAMGVAAYFVFSLVYQAIVQEENPQKVVESLGADSNTLLLVVGAVVVIAVAPVCEELFFRGILFTVLRRYMPFWPAALIDGILFGFVHGSLVIVPVLAALGLMFCYVYARTGSLFATIALHSLNNTIAYGVTTNDGWVPAAIVGALTIGACIAGLMRAPRRPAPARNGVGVAA